MPNLSLLMNAIKKKKQSYQIITFLASCFLYVCIKVIDLHHLHFSSAPLNFCFRRQVASCAMFNPIQYCLSRAGDLNEVTQMEMQEMRKI
jgi:hypothetical protein